MQRADFVTRLLAYLIDGAIVGAATTVIYLILGLLFGVAIGNAIGGTFGGIWTGLFLFLTWAIVFVGSIGYYVYFWTKTGQTIGKKVMKIKVVTKDGKLLTLTGALLRIVGYVVSGMIFYLGFLWILWDPEQQGWHDKIANTYVVKV